MSVGCGGGGGGSGIQSVPELLPPGDILGVTASIAFTSESLGASGVERRVNLYTHYGILSRKRRNGNTARVYAGQGKAIHAQRTTHTAWVCL